jgi:Zn finger protein HypA/HybF involved in hydrogenase expression
MSNEIAWKPEDAIGLPSEIAFKPEEGKLPRHIQRQMKKEKDYLFGCPSCGHEEIGGQTSFLWINQDPNTGKRNVFGRIPRKCPVCKSNMIKVNKKRWEERRQKNQKLKK